MKFDAGSALPRVYRVIDTVDDEPSEEMTDIFIGFRVLPSSSRVALRTGCFLLFGVSMMIFFVALLPLP